MLDPENTPADTAADAGADTSADTGSDETPRQDAAADAAPAKKTAKRPARKRAAKKTAAPESPSAEVASADPSDPADQPAEQPARKTAKKAASRKRAAAPPADEPAAEAATDAATETEAEPAGSSAPMVLFQAPETTAPAKKAAKKASKKAAAKKAAAAEPDGGTSGAEEPSADVKPAGKKAGKKAQKKTQPEPGSTDENEGEIPAAAASEDTPADQTPETDETPDETGADTGSDTGSEPGEGGRRRRRRGGRRRRRASDGPDSADGDESDESDASDQASQSADGQDADADSEDDNDSDDNTGGGSGGSRRRRRRRRTGDGDNGSSDDPEQTVTRARRQRNPEDEITGVSGSTRLEAKKQRRREGREAGRRRAPIVSEAEFLARRESVDRVMVIRQRDDITQIGVLEDKVLVEHYVARESQTSLIGNVYLGRVQNVLPSMEAAFIDIGKGRNAVLYAGEVNWSALGHKDGQPRKIESVLSSGQTILVQVTKDPIGHKGARLTGQISLPGRFLVYVPEGNTSGISRKLPDTERTRLKTLLKEIVPDSAGVIVRTAAEGASEEELTHDVERLTARWNDIEEKVKAGKSPQLLYGEPDLTLKVVRDLFTEDFGKLVVEGDDAWDLVDGYVSHVAPDLRDRLERFTPAEDGPDAGKDVFAAYRLDEQIAKGLDRKVWLPSGGSLIIDRTEAMTVVDVNTGKFTGSGGNLEETVTKNNLEAAEEVVRQLRLRDIGGIIVVDFIDMVLESNRDLVLRRLVECLGRDRTRHQVAEVTSLGLVQMTRKRIGTGLLEAFTTTCEHCKGTGVVLHDHPVESGSRPEDDEPRGRRRGGRNRSGGNGRQGGGNNQGSNQGGGKPSESQGSVAHHPSPADLAGSRPPEKAPEQPDEQPDERPDERPTQEQVEPPVTDAQPVAEQNVIGTPSGPSPEPLDVPSESAAPEPPEAPSDEQPAEPEPPRVVTRRRTARRAAGPPASTHVEPATDLPGTPAAPTAEPADVPVEPGPAADGSWPQDPQADEEEARPQDPVAPDADQEPDQTDNAEGADDTGDGEDAEEGSEESSGFSLLHVPIKRKGSRKR